MVINMLTELLQRHSEENEILKKEIQVLFELNQKHIWSKKKIINIVNTFFETKHPEFKENYMMKIEDISSDERLFEFFVVYDNIARNFSFSVKRLFQQ